MNAADFDDLSQEEKRHFYQCKQCGEMLDMRQLDDVLFHEDHVHRPDIPYGHWQATARRKMNAQLTVAVYEVRPRRDKRGADLISDALPFGRLRYNGSNAISNAIGLL